MGRRVEPARANANEAGIGRTTAVGMYPLGVPTPWPVLDLAGNVWEWCLNEYEQPDRTGPDGEASGAARRVVEPAIRGTAAPPAASTSARRPSLQRRLSGASWFPIELLATAPLNTGPPQR